MVEQLQRWREPAALVVLVTLGLRVLLGLVDLVVLLASRPWGADTPALAGLSLTSTAVDQVGAVVLALLVGCCVLPRPSPRARSLTSAAVLVVGLGLLAALAGLVVWAVTERGGVDRLGVLSRALLALPLPALALVVLVRLGRALPGGVHPGPTATDASEEMAAGPAPAALEPATDQRDEPTWQPDQASGAVWLTAGDAAAGAAATRWGTPGEQGGWDPRAEAPGDAGARPPARPVDGARNDDSSHQS